MTLEFTARQVEYNPYTNHLNLPNERGSGRLLPSGDAARFVDDTYGSLDIAAPLQSVGPWDARTAAKFGRLSPSDQLEVAIWDTLLLHELVHRIDYTHTPFGASYRLLCLAQARALLSVWPRVSADLTPTLPVCKWRLEGTDLQNDPGWTDLRKAHRELDEYYQTLPGARISPGFSIKGKPPHYVLTWPVIGPLSVITIANCDGSTQPTLRLPGFAGLYLRPKTALEARAVAVSANHLMQRLLSYDSQLAIRATGEYVSWAAEAPDYGFTLDIMTAAHGVVIKDWVKTFASLVTLALEKPDTRYQLVWGVLERTAGLVWAATAGPDIAERLFFLLAAYPRVVEAGYAEAGFLPSIEDLVNRIEGLLPPHGASVEHNLEALVIKLRSLNLSDLPSAISVHTGNLAEQILENLQIRCGKGHNHGFAVPKPSRLREAFETWSATSWTDALASTTPAWDPPGFDRWLTTRRTLLGPGLASVKQQAWRTFVESRSGGP